MSPVNKHYLHTPLLKCRELSSNQKANVYFKLENLQPSGSFKDRGISNMVNVISQSEHIGKLISSSGGNAGHAVATVGQALGISVDVYVPTTTKQMMVAKLKKKGANVFVSGANWNEADKFARMAVSEDPTAKYIPPYDDPRIWDGNSTLVDELAQEGIIPDEIVLSVGGGGLLCGIQRGILRHGWQDRTKIIAVETVGTASFAAGHAAGAPVALPGISSVATSLGALSVTAACLNTGVITDPYVVSDEVAVRSCRRFADDYNMLVEPACGAALSYVYFPDTSTVRPLLSTVDSVDSTTDRDHAGAEVQKETIVVVVCGGSVVSLELLTQWCADFGVTSEYPQPIASV